MVPQSLSVNTWSTPERRIGIRELPVIPNEIYLIIINYFQPLDEFGPADCMAVWSKLALVCRFFYSVTLPRLFKTLTISASESESDDNRPNTFNRPNANTFCRQLNNKKEPALSLSPHVEECIINDWNAFFETQASWANAFFASLYFPAMEKIENLTTVTLHKTPIFPKLLKTISKLQQLKSLRIDDCRFRDDVTVDHVERLSSLHLTSFHLFVSEFPLDLCLLEPLLASLEELRTNQWSFVEFVLHERELPSLRVLEIVSAEKFVVLCDILARAPALSDLAFDFAEIPEDLSLVPESSVRNLRRLRCPVSLCLHFPTSSMQLEYLFLDQGLQVQPGMVATPSLLHPSSSVRELHMSMFSYLRCDAISLLQVHPNLERLRLYAHNRFDIGSLMAFLVDESLEARITNLLKVRQVSPQALREFTLDVNQELVETTPSSFIYGFDLPFHKKIIKTLVEKGFSNLVRVSVLCHVSWRRQDSGSSEWEAFVSYEHRKVVRDMLKRWSVEVVDCNGCLEGVWRLEVE